MCVFCHPYILIRCVSHSPLQARIHQSTDCKFYIFAKTTPIIEHCNSVQFAPFMLQYKELEEHLQAATFVLSQNHWDQVKDFNWIKTTASPNWSILADADRVMKSV